MNKNVRWEKTYHVGLIKGIRTLVIQAEPCIDCLSPQLWKYLGERVTTKKRLKETMYLTLEAVNGKYGTTFDRVQVI